MALEQNPGRRLLKKTAAKEIAGGISDQTWWRWKQAFPDFPPITMISGRCYVWSDAWEKFLVARARSDAA